jgi:hypothetical protein
MNLSMMRSATAKSTKKGRETNDGSMIKKSGSLKLSP